jgi:hypothetical protein
VAFQVGSPMLYPVVIHLFCICHLYPMFAPMFPTWKTAVPSSPASLRLDLPSLESSPAGCVQRTRRDNWDNWETVEIFTGTFCTQAWAKNAREIWYEE